MIAFAPKVSAQKNERSFPRVSSNSHRRLTLEEGDPPRAGDVKPQPDRVEEECVETDAKRDKRLKGESAKSEALGLNPKEARERARATLQSEYYVSTPGRSGVKVLHRLGSCYIAPGIHYPRFA